MWVVYRLPSVSPEPRRAREELVFEYSLGWRVFGRVMSALWILLPTLAVASDCRRGNAARGDIVEYLVAMVFIGSAAYAGLRELRRRIVFEESALRVESPWTGTRVVPWTSILRIEGGAKAPRLVTHDGARLGPNAMMDGCATFASHAREAMAVKRTPFRGDGIGAPELTPRAPR